MKTQTAPETELFDPVDLCNQRGLLRRETIGWSRRPLHRCNLRGHWSRKKRWDYWCITSEDRLFSATVADADYLGTCFVYFLDFRANRYLEETVLTPFGWRSHLGDSVGGRVEFSGRRLHMEVRDSGECVRLRVHSPSFGGQPLDADLAIERPAGHETLNAVIPWNRHRFHFTSKQNCLPAGGTVRIGDKVYEFEPGASFACLDFGRGMWKYRTAWNWGAASGVQDGRVVGLNLGAGWTDGTGMTENGLCIDGRLTKLNEELSFDYDRSDYMRPWRVASIGSERVDLTFEPFFERVARTDVLILRSETHQMIGRYSGSVVTDAGEKLTLSGLLGWVEQHQARW